MSLKERRKKNIYVPEKVKELIVIHEKELIKEKEWMKMQQM
jgi:hypothetical protein